MPALKLLRRSALPEGDHALVEQLPDHQEVADLQHVEEEGDHHEGQKADDPEET